MQRQPAVDYVGTEVVMIEGLVAVENGERGVLLVGGESASAGSSCLTCNTFGRPLFELMCSSHARRRMHGTRCALLQGSIKGYGNLKPYLSLYLQREPQ